jgi:hypothetical protein
MRAPRWYFDADTIGVGKLLQDARRDVTWPGDDGIRRRPHNYQIPCPVKETDTKDPVWIPIVASAGMTIITRDKKIQTRTAEINAIKDASARMFAITSDEVLDRWGLLEVVVSQWRAMERVVDETPGPFIYSLTRTALRRLI